MTGRNRNARALLTSALSLAGASLASRCVLALAAVLAGWGEPLVAQQTAPPLAGAATQYGRRLIDVEAGLPESQVNAIARTPDGYLWLGTRRGLARYDGLQFAVFSRANTEEFPHDWINAVAADTAGRVWVGTAAGLVWRDSVGWHRVDPAQIPAAEVWESIEDRRGRRWVATESGVFVGDGVRFRRVEGTTAYTYALAEDSAGRIWMAGRGFLGYADGDRVVDVGRMVGYGPRYFDVMVDRTEGVWVGTRGAAIRVVLTPSGTPVVRNVIAAIDRGNARPIWTLAQDSDGSLWMGTEGSGTYFWDGNRVSAPGFGSHDTWAIFVDPNGTVYAGTGVGLERFKRSPFTTVATGLPPSPGVWSVQIDSRGGLWTAIADGSVYRWQGSTFTRVIRGSEDALSSAIAPAADGMLVGTPDGAVLMYGRDGARSRLPLGGVGAVLGAYADGPERVWISSDSGLYLIEGGRARRMNEAFGLARDVSPRAVWRDAAGRLLLGNPGLTVVDGERVRHFGVAEGLSDLNVRAVFARGDEVWIGTRSDGLFVLQGDRIHRLAALDPALDHDVIGIGDDGRGYLWLTQRFSVTRVRIEDLMRRLAGGTGPIDLRSFNAADGLPAARFNDDYQSVLVRDSAGTLWLPNAAGAVRVNVAAVREDSVAPRVVVERMIVRGTDHAPMASPVLPSGVGRLAFAVAVPGMLKPTAVRLQFRLLSSDTTWTDAGQNRLIAFGPLRGGDYRLELRAAAAPERWGPVQAVDFAVARTLVERTWFVPFILAVAIGVVAAGAAYRQRRLAAYSAALAQTVAERTRELELERASLETRVRERTAELAGELARRSQLEEDLVQAQKLEGMGRLAGSVAHEVNNSMTSLLAFAQLAAQSAEGRPDIQAELAEVRRAGNRVSHVMRQLLHFSRRHALDVAPVDVADLVRSMDRAVRQAAGDRVEVSVVAADDVPVVPGDRARLEQVILNLVVNARHAMPDGGVLTIRARRDSVAALPDAGATSLGAGDYAVVAITDTGIGMADDVRSRVFEPFFTTKSADVGSGLGLPVCHGIVRQHGGDIRVRSAPRRGSTFEVWLPVMGRPHRDEGVAILTAPAPIDSQLTETATVLVVDDEPMIRESVRRQLTRERFAVVTAGSGAEALELFAGSNGAVDVVVSDVMMPGMSGLEFARELRRRHGPVPVVFVSGFIGGSDAWERELQAMGPLVAKPFEAATLLASLRAALASRQSA